MTTWVVIAFALAMFCTLQAVYGFRRVGKKRRAAVIQDRLLVDAPDDTGDAGEGGGEDDDKAGALLSFLDESGAKERLEDLLYQAGETGDAASVVVRMVAFGILPTAAVMILTLSPGVIVLLPVFASIPLVTLIVQRSRRVRRIDELLPVALEVMTISLRAGQSLAMTLEGCAGEVPSPLREELQRCVEEHKLGRSIEEALVRMSRRLPGCRALRTFVVAVLVLQQTGGNLIEVIGRIIETLRMQTAYEKKLSAMTAEGKSSARMLGGLPMAFLFLAYIADPDYIGVLFTDSTGNKLLFASVTLWLIGVLWTRKLVAPTG